MTQRKPKVHTFIVTVPATIAKHHARKYVRDAVRGWVGGGDPDHPYYGALHSKRAVSANFVPEVPRGN